MPELSNYESQNVLFDKNRKFILDDPFGSKFIFLSFDDEVIHFEYDTVIKLSDLEEKYKDKFRDSINIKMSINTDFLYKLTFDKEIKEWIFLSEHLPLG